MNIPLLLVNLGLLLLAAIAIWIIVRSSRQRRLERSVTQHPAGAPTAAPVAAPVAPAAAPVAPGELHTPAAGFPATDTIVANGAANVTQLGHQAPAPQAPSAAPVAAAPAEPVIDLTAAAPSVAPASAATSKLPPSLNRHVVLGVVGCGYWGSKHVRVLSQQPDASVVAIDRDVDRLLDLRDSFPSLSVASGLDEVVHDLDGLVIATPASSHADLAVKAIEHGVHVLVEKPLATSVADATRILDAAKANGVTVTVGHTFEFNPAVWALRDVVHSAEFGDIHYIDSARLNLGLYQPDVNVLWDLAPHDISIVLYLLDTVPNSVCTWATRHVPGQREDVAYLEMRFDDLNITANIHVSWLDPAKVRRTTVVGSRQMAVYNDMSNERIRIYDKGIASEASDPLHQAQLVYREGNILSPFVDGREPLGLEAASFVKAVRYGSPSDVDGQRGLNVVRVLEAAQRSIETGGRVYLDPPHAANGHRATGNDTAAANGRVHTRTA